LTTISQACRWSGCRRRPCASASGIRPVWTPEHSVEKKFTDRTPALAAVLLPLVMREELTLLLTERTTNLSTHSGQVALPGGRTDDTDRDAVDTALREAHEEIGLPRDHVEVLGTLPTYVTGTAFIITPVVALVKPGFVLQPNPGEVADVFEVPLGYLMNPAHHRRHEVEFDGVHPPMAVHAVLRSFPREATAAKPASATSGARRPACCATSTVFSAPVQARFV
jgi:8-oxo-dGTP pyrophosphatase MutT (NUDIX family)